MELEDTIVTERIRKVKRTGRLCWSDHIERMDENYWVKQVKYYSEVEGRVPVG